MARTEDEILSGVLNVRLGGIERGVPELRIKALRAWKKEVVDVLGSLDNLDLDGVGGIGKIADFASDQVMGLVLSYDKEGKLGTKAEIEEIATEAQVYQVFRAMLDAAFPFVADLRGLMALQQAVPPPSGKASSTNGHSLTGVSTPKPSKAG